MNILNLANYFRLKRNPKESKNLNFLSQNKRILLNIKLMVTDKTLKIIKMNIRTLKLKNQKRKLVVLQVLETLKIEK